MTCRGKVTGGVVVLEKPDALPEGAEVKVELVAKRKRASRMPSPADKLRALGGKARKGVDGWEELLRLAGSVKGLPSDLAENHDHYLYGVPKRKR